MSEKPFLNESYYHSIRRPVEHALSMSPEAYRSPEFFEAEQERVFGKSWVCVGYTAELPEPGHVLPFVVGGQPVIVMRDADGIRGFYNVCRHRGSLLVQEPCKQTRLRCSYHGWTYGLAGNLEACPLFEDSGVKGEKYPGFSKDDFHLLPVRVETWGCFIFVNLDPNAIPLTEYLGSMVDQYRGFPWDELILIRRKRYDVKANWKLAVENFLEYYHLPWVHPELCKVTAIDMHQRNQGSGMYMSFFASPLLEGNTPLDAGFLPPMKGMADEHKNAGYFPAVFPNAAMFLLPHHLFNLIITPVAADKTEELGDLLVHRSVLLEPDAEKKIDEIFAFYDMVNLQDIRAVELVQRGVQARAYPGGRMTYRFEEPVHRFQNMVADYMVGAPRIPEGD